MADKYTQPDWHDIDESVYDWSIKLFRRLKKTLKVSMQLHAEQQIHQGNIFLFNHFSRFETFIPQYLIYEASGDYCYSIASSEFFEEDTLLAKYLAQVGVLPHDHQQLFPILAKQLLKGRKVIIFPEGGMVKDHQVMDKRGKFSIFSRMHGIRRKQHTGAAVLAQGLEAFKATIRNAYSDKNVAQLVEWKETLELDNLDQILLTALQPTLIVPAYITFYPVRSSSNLLHSGIELFSKQLSLRQTEELLIEGNIILKDTDMDIVMGKTIDPYHVWGWWNRYILGLVAAEFQTLQEVFALHSAPKSWRQKILGQYFRRNAEVTRNEYMQEMYTNVMVNLSHLASALIFDCIARKQYRIEKKNFHAALYIAIKRLQKMADIRLHRSLLNPDQYAGLLEEQCRGFSQFITQAQRTGLIDIMAGEYHFLAKLCEDFHLDEIRMENMILVYHNEIMPVPVVRETVRDALEAVARVTPKQFSHWFFSDECRRLEYDKKRYEQTEFDPINQHETATADPQPFLLQPKHGNGYAILLIHGLLASPAELRSFGEHLYKQGYTVLGIRLKGHGTSPHDLRSRNWEDWFESVRMGLSILTPFCQSVFVVGFSTGGALALMLAAEYSENVKAVIAVSVPVKFVSSSMMLVPLLHGTNQLIEWVSSYEGVKPFIENDTERPTINYQHIPVRGLYELRRLIQALDDALPKIQVPVLMIHANQDPVIEPASVELIMDKLILDQKQCVMVEAKKHGILADNSQGTWDIIDQFLVKHASVDD